MVFKHFIFSETQHKLCFIEFGCSKHSYCVELKCVSTHQEAIRDGKSSSNSTMFNVSYNKTKRSSDALIFSFMHREVHREGQLLLCQSVSQSVNQSAIIWRSSLIVKIVENVKTLKTVKTVKIMKIMKTLKTMKTMKDAHIVCSSWFLKWAALNVLWVLGTINDSNFHLKYQFLWRKTKWCQYYPVGCSFQCMYSFSVDGIH